MIDPNKTQPTAKEAAPASPVHSPGSIAPMAKGSPKGDEPTNYKGEVPLKANQAVVATDTIPAVEGTTLTQVPDPLTAAAMTQAGGQHVPFGRQMNSAHGYPSDIIHDPQVYPRAEVPGAEDRGGAKQGKKIETTGSGALSKSSLS